MSPVRVLDTQRLATLASAYEREMVQFHHDLAVPGAAPARIRQEMEKAGFEGIHLDGAGNLLGRIDSGKHVIALESPANAAGIAAMVYAGKLIHELGMYDHFSLWVCAMGPAAIRPGALRPDCRLIAEPTNLRIYRTPALEESHPLVQAAIAAYETLFELPPIVGKGTANVNGVPTILFGPGEDAEGVPVRHLMKAAQFYAAFPTMFVDTVTRR